MTEMTWPDGEKLRYLYDNGGLLKAAWGEKKGNRYDYVKTLTYDEFGQRKWIEYGNGTVSTYAYDELTRRLDTLVTALPASQGSRTIQNLKYTYDLVGNVKVLANGIEVPTNTALPAGPVRQEFDYDDLYQITEAKGEYAFGPGKGNAYTNNFIYDTIGNITKKDQSHWIIQPSTTKLYPKETNYVLNYVYGSSKPHAVTDAGDKLYTYDPAGNMTGWTHKTNGTRRTIYWNEENRVKQIDDNGKATYFLYDDAGERVVKRGQHGESIYVNRFYSVRNGELGTKHVFAGETRVVSKLVKTPNTNTANTSTTITTSNVTSSTTTTIPGIQGLDNGRGKKLGIIRRLPDGYQVGINPPVEKDQFYYHGDHLGSSSFITDDAGAVYQHLEYFPYGETWVEDGGSGQMPNYRFTGKELDPETGLYYYGARYYDPVLSRWINADPILEKYLPSRVGNMNDVDIENTLPGHGGVYRSLNLNTFAYAHNSPVVLTDPDGNFAWKIPFVQAYFVAEFKTTSSFKGISMGIVTSNALVQRHLYLTLLSDRMRQPAEKTLARLEAQGKQPSFVEKPLRTIEEQKEKIRQGYSKPSSLYTGKHVDRGTGKAEAMDIMDKRWGQIDETKEQQQFFKDLGKVGESEGLIWGGRFNPMSERTGYGWDPAHLEMPDLPKPQRGGGTGTSGELISAPTPDSGF